MSKRSSSTANKDSNSATSSRRPPTSLESRKGKPSPAAVQKGTAPAAVHPPPVRIGYFQPEAREVYVAGSFNKWNTRATPMTRDSLGDWSIELSLPPGEHRYRLIVDGEWRDDPSAQRVEANPYGGFDAVIFVQ